MKIKYDILPEIFTRAERVIVLNDWAARGWKVRHVYPNGDHLMEFAAEEVIRVPAEVPAGKEAVAVAPAVPVAQPIPVLPRVAPPSPPQPQQQPLSSFVPRKQQQGNRR